MTKRISSAAQEYSLILYFEDRSPAVAEATPAVRLNARFCRRKRGKEGDVSARIEAGECEGNVA